MAVSSDMISVRFSEPHLSERNVVLATLLDMSTFLSSSLDLTDMLEGALSKVLELIHFSAGRIYLLDESGEVLTLGASIGADTRGLEKLKISEGFSGKSVRTRSFLAQPVAELEDKARAEILLSKGFRFIICVPLIALGRVMGVMNLASDEMAEFDEATIDLLIALGNQIAVAANNSGLHQELKNKVAELKHQKEAVEYFAYSISHDLKSPAVGIYGLTRRLNAHYKNILDERGRLYCDQILKASEQIARLVDRINAYIMAKEAPLHFEQFNLKEILDLIHSEFQEAMAKRNVTWAEPEQLPCLVADKVSIARVLRNLVDNALKYGGEHLREVRIEYRREGDRHILSIADDGVALKVEDVRNLFSLFHREKTSRGTEGTGLGLATVKEIAERHGGGVWVESGDERGTTFFVSISTDLAAA